MAHRCRFLSDMFLLRSENQRKKLINLRARFESNAK